MITRSASASARKEKGRRESAEGFERKSSRDSQSWREEKQKMERTDDLSIIKLETLEDISSILIFLDEHVLDVDVRVDLDSESLDSTEDHFTGGFIKLTRERVSGSVDDALRNGDGKEKQRED